MMINFPKLCFFLFTSVCRMPYEYVMSNIVSARNRCEARAVTVAMRDPRVDRSSSTRTLKAQQVSGSVQQVHHLIHTHTCSGELH